MNCDFFPFGTQYHRAPTPLPEEWEPDLAALRDAGYTHVQFRPQWRRHERVRGQYVWDDLDRLCDLAHQYGLKVIIKSMLETAPDWVFTELGGTRVGFRGVPIPPISHAAFYVGGWWPCFDNPAVAGAAFEFNRRLGERYRNHPALWFFNAWNEPRSRPAGDCHCPHSAASYRKWLQERFGSIEALNQAYGKEWTGFDTVMPPEAVSDYAEMHLWRQWAEFSVASKVRVSYEGLKAGAPDRTVMAHIGASSVVQDPICDTSYDILNAQQVDFYGCSYPVELRPKDWMGESDPFYQSAWMRRVDPGFWIQEFYPNNAMWCEPPKPDKLEQILLMALASGCRGFTFWQFRSERFGEESNGWGMREIDGSPSERSIVCDRVAAGVAGFGAELTGAQVAPAPVGILYHRANDMLGRLQASPYLDLTEMDKLSGNIDYPARMALRRSFAMYRLLGHNADLIVPGDDLSRYRLIHLPAVELIEPELAEALERYVAGGGTLVISYPFACREANTWVTPQRPSLGLDRLTGCREGQRRALPAGRAAARRGGDEIYGGGWYVELTPTTGEVLASWRDAPGAAAVHHRHGAGQVFTLGANLELGWSGEVGDANLAFLGEIAEAAGLATAADPCRWEMRRGAFRFVFNLGEALLPVAPEAGEEPVYWAGRDGGALRRYGVAVFRRRQ